MNIMLLCAGEGRRLRPFTEHCPKPSIPFMSVPLAYYSISLLDHIPIDRLVVNTHHLPEQIESLFNYIPAHWRDLEISHEKEILLGSGGGIHFAQKHLEGGGDFFVLNGDEVILPHQMGTMEEMVAFHRFHKGIATLLTIPHPEVGKKFGGAWTKSGETQIECFSKTQPKLGHLQGHHFIGVMILSERIFSYFKSDMVEENILYETLTKAMAQGEQVHAFETEAEWFETGNPDDFLKAAEICLDAVIDKPVLAPYWIDYLAQTIRLFGKDQFIIEKNWPRFKELMHTIHRIKMGDL